MAQLVNDAQAAGDYKIEKVAELQVSNDIENHWYAIHNGWDKQMLKVITQNGDNQALDAQEYVASGAQIWRFVKSGSQEGVYRIENRWGQNISATGKQGATPMAYTSMANSKMLVKLTTDNSGCWTIVPVANGNVYQSLYYNNSMTSWTWRADDGGYASASTWTIENVPDMMVPEVVSQDYERYMRRLDGFDGTPMEGKLGQARSSALLQAAKDSITLWNSNIAHESLRPIPREVGEACAEDLCLWHRCRCQQAHRPSHQRESREAALRLLRHGGGLLSCHEH